MFKIFKNIKQNDSTGKIKGNLKRNIKLLTISIIAAFILIVVISIFFFLKFTRIDKFKKYEEKMSTYGFSMLYNNSSAKSDEIVTKAEAIKLIIAATTNTYYMDYYTFEDNQYDNANWVNFAINNKIVLNEVNIKNYNENIKYIDVINYLSNSKMILLKDTEKTDTDINIKNINIYSSNEQANIKDLIADEIIQVEKEDINGEESVFKGKLNEVIVNFVEKYNIISSNNEKLNINPDKNPSNASEYPYILSTVDKSIYEIPFIKSTSNAKNAKEIYSLRKDRYEQIEGKSKIFFDTIFNINYNTIDSNKLYEAFSNVSLTPEEIEGINIYVNYVKENKIIISGDAKLQMPIIYYDGINFRARYLLNFKIESSNTKENLLYIDWLGTSSTSYQNKEYSNLVIDYYLTEAGGSNNMYIKMNDLYSSIIDLTSSNIVQLSNEREAK